MLRPILWQLGGTAACALVSLALLSWLARALGAEAFGLYIGLLSAGVLVQVLLEGGWPALLYREAVAPSLPAPEPVLARYAVAHVLRATLVASALGALVFASRAGTGVALMACMGLAALANLVSGRLRGRGRFAAEALWQLASRVASAVAIVLAVSTLGGSAGVIFGAWALGLLAVLVAGRRWLARPASSHWRTHARLALSLVGVELLRIAMLRGDMVALPLLLRDPVALSHYAACTRVIEFAVLALAPGANVLIHRLRSQRAMPARQARTLWLAVGAAMLLGVVAWLASVLLADWLVVALFGPEFAAAAPLLPWVTLALPAILANVVLVQALIANDAESRAVQALAVAGAVLLFALWQGTRMHGATGAAVAVAAANLVLLVLLALALRGAPKGAACESA